MFSGNMVPRFLVIAGGGGSTVPTITANTTVRVPTDYATLSDAIVFAESNLYVNGAILTIEVEPGHTITGSHDWRGKNLPNVEINFNGAPSEIDASTYTIGIGFILDASTSFYRIRGRLRQTGANGTLYYDYGSSVSYGEALSAAVFELGGNPSFTCNAVVSGNSQFTNFALNERIEFTVESMRASISEGSGMTDIDINLNNAVISSPTNFNVTNGLDIVARNSRVQLGNLICSSLGLTSINSSFNAGVISGPPLTTADLNISNGGFLGVSDISADDLQVTFSYGGAFSASNITAGTWECNNFQFGDGIFNATSLSWTPNAATERLAFVDSGSLRMVINGILTVDGTVANPTRTAFVNENAEFYLNSGSRSYINGATAPTVPYATNINSSSDTVCPNYSPNKYKAPIVRDNLANSVQSGSGAVAPPAGTLQLTINTSFTSLNLDPMGNDYDAEIEVTNNTGGSITLVGSGAGSTTIVGTGGGVPNNASAILRRTTAANQWRVVSRQ